MTPDDHEADATEDWARTLLHRAGETVEVDPAGPLDGPAPRRVWPLLAAAAAVVAVAIATAVVTLGGDETAPPVTRPRDDGHFRLGPDQVPSVFGYDRESAVALLTERGLHVKVSARPDCLEPAGRALRTRPGVGRIVERGDSVTVIVSVGPSEMRCPFAGGPDRDLAWRFVDLARGGSSDPGLARSVTLVASDGRSRELTAEELTDADGWEVCAAGGGRCLSPLEQLRDAAGEVQLVSSRGLSFTTPSLSVTDARGIPCSDQVPSALRGRRGLELSITFPSDGVGPRPLCRGVSLFRNDAGEIDAVAVGDSWEQGYTLKPPTVVGMSITGARERLEEDGYTVAEVPRHDCAQPGIVTVQAPEPSVDGPPATDVVSLGVVDRRTRCNSKRFLTTPAELAGDALRDFARGHETAPPFAAEVGVYVGNQLQQSLSAEQAGEPASWDTCPTYAGRDCPLSALRQLATPGPVVQSGPPPEGSCLVRLEDLPPDLEARLGSSTRMDQPEARNCHDMWAVQVWVDDSGSIDAVNLLLGPAPERTSGLDLPPADADTQRVAELFAGFARGDRPDGAPVDTPVDLYLGNQFLETITAAEANDRSAWRGCPEGGSYAGRTCPFSWTRPIADYPARLAITSAAPEHPCAHPGPLPAELDAYHAVTLTPDEGLTCVDYWAVQLFVNDVGQVVAANLVWAEP